LEDLGEEFETHSQATWAPPSWATEFIAVAEEDALVQLRRAAVVVRRGVGRVFRQVGRELVEQQPRSVPDSASTVRTTPP